MILILAIILYLLLIIVGGDRGAITAMTIAGNVIILALTVVFIANGASVFPVLLVATLMISHLTLFHQNGKNIKTKAAWISVMGIMIFLSIIIAVVVWRAGGAGLNEIQAIQEDVAFYYDLDIDISMLQVWIGVVILSTLGAVIDTALSVTSAVHEVSVHRPGLDRKEYFLSGVRVGHDIIGTTANTLLFAYFGEAFLLFAYLIRGKYNWEIILNSRLLFQEIGMMAAGLSACLLAVPISAYVMSVLLTRNHKEDASSSF